MPRCCSPARPVPAAGGRSLGRAPAGARFPRARAGPRTVSCPAAAPDAAGLPLAALLAGVAVVEDLDAAAQLIAARPELTAVTRTGDVFTALTRDAAVPRRRRRCWKSRPPSTTPPRSWPPSPPRLERNRFALAAARARRAEAQDRADAALANAPRFRREAGGRRRTAGPAERGAAQRRRRRVERLAASLARRRGPHRQRTRVRLESGRRRGSPRPRSPRRRRNPPPEHRDALAAGRLAGPHGRDGGPARPAQRRGTAHGHRQPGGLAGTGRRHRTPRPRGSRGTGPPAPARRPGGRRRRRRRAARHRRSSTSPWSWPAASGTAPRNAGTRWRRELAAVRSGNDALARELARAHRLRAPRRARPHAAAAADRGAGDSKSVEELGLTAGQLVADYGPDQPVPVPCRRLGDKWAALRAPVDEDGREIPKASPSSARSRRSGSNAPNATSRPLGKVNPLALEEFAALEERHQFLSTQLEDLKSSRKDLLDIIKEVDERVAEGLHRGLRGHRPAVRARLRPAVPRRRGPAGPDRPGRHAHHRHRGRGPAGRARKSSGSRCSPAASVR